MFCTYTERIYVICITYFCRHPTVTTVSVQDDFPKFVEILAFSKSRDLNTNIQVPHNGLSLGIRVSIIVATCIKTSHTKHDQGGTTARSDHNSNRPPSECYKFLSSCANADMSMKLSLAFPFCFLVSAVLTAAAAARTLSEASPSGRLRRQKMTSLTSSGTG